MTRNCLALVIVASLAVPGFADDIEDPNFRTWSKFKVGTVTVVKFVMEGPDSKTESLVTTKLVEKNADAITIEVTGTSVTNGKETKSPARKERINKTRIRKQGESDDGYLPAVKEGTETVTIDGVEYKTKWKTFQGKDTPDLKVEHTI